MLNSKVFIIKEAFILFLEKGYKNVTIKNIMESTNLSKGAIYHHFENKEAIYLEALDSYFFNLLNSDTSKIITGNFKDDIITVYHMTANMFDGIEHIKKGRLNYPIRNFFSFQLESEQNTSIRERTILAVQDYRNEILNIVKHAKNTNQIKSDINSEAIAFQIIAILEGTCINHTTVKSNVKKVLLERYDMMFNNLFNLICIK